MVVGMRDLEELEASCPCIPSLLPTHEVLLAFQMLTCFSSAIDPPYPVHGGLQRKEAIMLLRRFYIQENEKGMLITCVAMFGRNCC